MYRLIIFLLVLAGCSAPDIPSVEAHADADSVGSPSIASWELTLKSTLQEIERLQYESMTQAQMNHTAFLELEVLEAELFMTMARYEAGCTVDEKSVLQRDHQSWLERRDAASLEARSEHAGGTIAPLIQATEMSEWTRYRIASIAALDARNARCDPPAADLVEWKLTDQGLQDGDTVVLDGTTGFTLEAVRSVLPAGTVSEGIHEDEGGTRRVLLLSDGLEHMGRIYGGENGAISILEIDLAGVTGPEDGIIGWPMSYLSPARFQCEPGMEHLSGRAVCRDDNHPSIAYVFASDDWIGPDGELPDDSILQSWTLWTLYWTAPE